MQYNVQSFNQIECIKLGLSNDDLTILNWFLRFKDTGKMDCINIESAKQYGFWVNYTKLIDDMPILFNGQDYLESQLKLKPFELKLLNLEKQGLKYAEEYKELEKELKQIKNKCYQKHKQKLKRIFSGPLNQILLKKEKKLGDKEGTKIYLYLNYENFNKINNSTTTLNEYLKENGVEVEESNNFTPYKNVPCNTPYKNVPCITPYKNVPSDTNTNNTNTIDINTTHHLKNEVVVSDTNKELIEKNTHLKLESTYKKNKVKNWDKERLLKSIDIFKEKEGVHFSLLEKIYKSDENFVPKNNNKNTSNNKNRFHNLENESFRNYTSEELEKLIEENQKHKFSEPKRNNLHEHLDQYEKIEKEFEW